MEEARKKKEKEKEVLQSWVKEHKSTYEKPLYKKLYESYEEKRKQEYIQD